MELLEKYGRLIVKAHKPRESTDHWFDAVLTVVIEYVSRNHLSIYPVDPNSVDDYGSPEYLERARKEGWKPIIENGQLLGFKKIEVM